MSRDLELRVAAFQLAQQRLAVGLPIWAESIDVADVFHNKDLSFEQIRDFVVERFRKSNWVQVNERVQELLELLAESEDEDAFNSIFDELYDIADIDRVWIKTLGLV